MKRRHSRKDTIAFCDEVRRLRPEVAFGADLIAGFPTETDEMAANSRALIEDAGLSYLHVFPFSPRKGTPAARMPQLPKPLIKERAARLRAVGDKALAARMTSLIGSEQTLLVEKDGSGRTQCFAQAHFAHAAQPGSFARVRIADATPTHLIAEAIP
jgi:threonylcarbamoyladenosine tRNA methylthiotransferase MtaB